MRVYLDARVLAAAFATRGLCADVLRVVLTRHQLVATRALLRETRRLLVDELRVPAVIADQIVPFVREHADVSNAKEPVVDFLVTASGTLGEDAPVSAVTPRGFWERLRQATVAE
ncbi:MAG: hypothetical protein ACE5LB_08450 [Acidiferrobacterales bacterium]